MVSVSSYQISTPSLKMEVPDETGEKEQSIILVEFSNGHLMSLKNSGLKYTCYKCIVRKSISQRILVAESSRLQYTGSNFESDLSKITSSVLKICIINRKTSSIKLLDADLFHMKPLLKIPVFDESKETRSYVEMSSDLTLAFGSKIKKKTLNSKLKYSSANVSTSSDFIDEILTESDATVDQKKGYLSTENTFSVIPPQNSSAVNVDEVYNLYDILSKDEYTELDSEAKIFINAKYDDIDLWKRENKFCTFILQYLINNFASMNLHKAKLLCYAHYMFCFLKAGYADLRKKDPFPEVPEPFKQNLINSFTLKRSMPPRMKDKLLAHIIVLGLMLNNYVFNGSIIASSTKISAKRIVTVAHALGCHVSESKNEDAKIIELKLPLFKFQAGHKQRKN